MFLVLVTNSKYFACLSFSDLQPKLIEYPRFTNAGGKASKKLMLWHSETWFDIHCLTVTNRKYFSFACHNI